MSKEFYEIEVQSYDWIYILTKMLRRYTEAGRGIEVDITKDATATFQIPRKLVPASAIAQVIGSTEEAVNKTKTIRLIPFKRMKDWQEPTVDYCGEA